MATNLNHLSEESAILSLKILLRSYPYGVEIREVNGLFIRRFGVQLDPLSYDCFSLQKFLLKIAKYDGSFIIIESRIKLSKSYMEKVDIANSVLLSKPPSGPQKEDVWRSPSEEEDNREKEFPLGLPEASTTGYPKVVFGAFDASFSDDKSDYLSRYDTVPSLNLSRPIRRGDFLEIKIVSIQNPQSFQVRILGPKDLTENNVFTKMSVFTQRISNFYYAYKGQKILQVSSHDFPLDGGVFACPYTSSRSGKVEWRRALVTTRVDSNRHLVYFFDHGLYCEVDYRCLKKLYRPFADVPVQAIEAQMAGIAPFDKCLWNSSEKTFFKRAVARCKKHVMLALVIQRVEVSTNSF